MPIVIIRNDIYNDSLPSCWSFTLTSAQKYEIIFYMDAEDYEWQINERLNEAIFKIYSSDLTKSEIKFIDDVFKRVYSGKIQLQRIIVKKNENVVFDNNEDIVLVESPRDEISDFMLDNVENYGNKATVDIVKNLLKFIR